MSDYSIQMKKNTDGVWDNHFPITKTTLVNDIERQKNLSTILNDFDTKIKNAEKALYTVNVKDFGAVGDGIKDDSISFKKAFDYALNNKKTVFVPDGNYSINSVEVKTSMQVSNETFFTFNGQSSKKMIIISTNNGVFNTLRLDGKNQACTLLSITGDENIFSTIEIKNITLSTATPSHCFGVIIGGSKNKIDCIIGDNFVNGGYSNESFPQSVLTEGDLNSIGKIELNTVASGLVTAGLPTAKTLTLVDSLKIINGSDNGIYNLSHSSLKIGSVFYNGNEEPAVFGGDDVFIDSFHIKGKASRIGFQNVGTVRINKLFFEIDRNGNGASALFRTRSGNVRCGNISIGSISGEITSTRAGEQLCLLDEGIIEYLTIESINLVHVYKNAYDNLSRWARFNACQQLKIKHVYIKIIDLDDQFTDSDIFQLSLPTFIKKSFFHDLKLEIIASDGVSVSPALFRGDRFKQQNLDVSGMAFQSNVGPYVRELKYGKAETVNGLPSIGYWTKGERYYNNQVTTSSALGWVCTESGSPGTWREF